MIVTKPSIDDLRIAAEVYGFNLSAEDLAAYQMLSEGVIGSLSRLDELVESGPAVKYSRDAGHRPTLDEDPLYAWYWKCSIKGAASGRLLGKKIAVKDNICVAGMPLMNGSSILEGYVPFAKVYVFRVAATVVTRERSVANQQTHVSAR